MARGMTWFGCKQTVSKLQTECLQFVMVISVKYDWNIN